MGALHRKEPVLSTDFSAQIPRLFFNGTVLDHPAPQALLAYSMIHLSWRLVVKKMVSGVLWLHGGALSSLYLILQNLAFLKATDSSYVRVSWTALDIIFGSTY